MYQVFEYLTVGERAYLQTLNREALKAARDLNYQYTQQNRTLAAFLLSQEEKIFEYEHFICIMCKWLFVNPTKYRGMSQYWDCQSCNVKWCFACEYNVRINKKQDSNTKVYLKLYGEPYPSPYNYFDVAHNHHIVNN